MSKLNKILAALLLMQGVLVAVTWATRGGSSEPPGARPIFDGAVEDITAITIEGQPDKDGEGEKPQASPERPSVTLQRQGDGWIISSAGDYPAKTEKVKELLDKLVALRIRRPIATQASNHVNLKVGDDTYAKKITVTVKGEARTFYVGPGASTSVHVRAAGEDEVYRASGLSEWALGATPRTYLNTTYVSVEGDDLEGIELTNGKGTLKLIREASAWQLVGAPEGSTLDETKLNTLVNSVSKVYLSEPVGKEEKPEYKLGEGATVTLTYTEGEGDEAQKKTLRYRVGAEKGDSAYMYVKADERDYVVLASKYSVEGAMLRGADELIKKPKAPPTP